MVRAAFDIVSPQIQPYELKNCVVVMEVAEKEFCYVIYNKEQHRFRGLRKYSFDVSADRTTADVLRDIIAEDDLLQMDPKEAAVVYNYADSNLLPEKYFNIDIARPITELVHGDAQKGLLLSEKVQGWEMYNIYRVPRDVHTLFQQKFAAGKYWHFYSLLMVSLKKEDGFDGALLHTVFYADKFITAVLKEGRLQLLQSYEYQTPDDVSYYLLSICRQFGIEPAGLTIQAAGLLDGQSNLYTELMKYFSGVQWDSLPGNFRQEELLSEYPPHYFSPVMKLVLCV